MRYRPFEHFLVGLFYVRIDAEYPCGLLMIFIIIKFVADIKDEEQAESDAYHQPKNIKQAVAGISFKISDRNYEKVLDHRGWLNGFTFQTYSLFIQSTL